MGADTGLPLQPGALPPYVVAASLSVKVLGLDPALLLYLEKAGKIHQSLFNKDLVITSALDGAHAANSKHYSGAAVDLRMKDKTPVEQLVFLVVGIFLAIQFQLAVFDERAQPGEGHLHIECAG